MHKTLQNVSNPVSLKIDFNVIANNCNYTKKNPWNTKAWTVE